jgi:hypothetical protein
MCIETHIPLLESILGEWKSAIGSQYEPYKNHVYRVLNFCFIFHQCQDNDREKLIIAGCFHDLGIWPNDTVDYLPPSIELAKTYLKNQGKEEWTTEITRMIDLHHKFTPVPKSESRLVEVFRRGDWVDVTQGLRSFGLPKVYIQEVLKTFPNLGFHDNLLRLTKEEFKRNPLKPLPMMKW